MSLEKALQNYLSIDFDAMRPLGFLHQEAEQIRTTVTNVDEGQGWILNHACPDCGSKRRETRLERFGRKVLQCLDCNLGYMDAFPVDPTDVYSHESYIGTQQSGYLENVDYRKERFARERLDIIQRHLKRGPAGARLLDVGCGTGWFLEAAREEGYRVSGLEIGRELARFTSERLGVPIHNVSLAELSADETYDVITLFDVLEHVTNPRAMLREVRRHLNPGGIVLLFTPNLDSVGIALLREQSSLIMPAEHLFYFTPASLRRLIEQTPLEILEFATKGMDMPDFYSQCRDFEETRPVADFLGARGPLLQAVIDAAGCANHMRFSARREASTRDGDEETLSAS